MERLTNNITENFNGIKIKTNMIIPKNEVKSYDELEEWYQRCSEKLAYYEDLEESGLLLKLPYPVGTPLFIPCREQGVKRDHIRRWQTNNKGLMFCSNGSFYLAYAIGKSVFLTRDEAEEKLICFEVK